MRSKMTKHDIMINFVKQQASLSKCEDVKTAAVLVSADLKQIYSIGINGGPIGGIQCMCGTENKNDITGKAKYTCVHSEMNCLVKNMVINDIPKILICTKQPCAICASLIINSCTNIIEVWYIDEYWDNTGIEILREGNIFTDQLIEYEKDRYCFAGGRIWLQ